ncbi:MAG: hypothetical protein JO180_05925 [Gemmatirosa sp.]|nr:hypothetical protein [Gemmatirosa sp.]
MDFMTSLVTVSMVAGVVGVPLYLVWRFLRAYERRTAVHAASRQLRERVTALEARIEVLEAEHEQLTEGQRFTSAVLAARPTTRLDASSSDTT